MKTEYKIYTDEIYLRIFKLLLKKIKASSKYY